MSDGFYDGLTHYGPEGAVDMEPVLFGIGLHIGYLLRLLASDPEGTCSQVWEGIGHYDDDSKAMLLLGCLLMLQANGAGES